MILSGYEIKNRLNTDIFIKPFQIENLGVNSYDLSLHNKLMCYKSDIIDMKEDNKYTTNNIPKSGYTLQPGVLYLGRTVEYTKTFNFVPMLEGRSSIGRLGISIHATAGFGDVGFCGYWTLEISCVEPVTIYPYVKICQIYYYEVIGNIGNGYQGKYQKNKGINTSRIYEEF